MVVVVMASFLGHDNCREGLVELDSSDVRDVIKIGRLADNIPDISLIIKMMKNKRYQ